MTKELAYEHKRDATIVASWDAGQTPTFGRKTGDVKRCTGYEWLDFRSKKR